MDLSWATAGLLRLRDIYFTAGSPAYISLKFRHRGDRLDGGPYLWNSTESPMATTTYAAADRGVPSLPECAAGLCVRTPSL